MSVTTSHRLVCSCGAEQVVRLADSANAGRHPAWREAALTGWFHRFACAACGEHTVIEKQVFYFDLQRRHFLGVFPRADLADARARAELVVATYQRWLCDDAPAMLRDLAPTFLVRVCFGYDELRDKLVADDAGLEDLVVEAVKARVLATDPVFASNGVSELWLQRVDPDGALELAWHPAEGGSELVRVARAVYDALAPDLDTLLTHRPCLASGPHVSIRRLGLISPELS